MLEEKTYKLIDSYLRKDLSQQEHANFEELLLRNSELADEVEVQRNLYRAIGKTNLEEDSFIASEEGSKIQSAINDAQQTYHDNKVKPLHRRYIISIAASFLIIVGCFYFFTNSNGTQGLYATYANWEELPSLTVRANTDNNLADAEIEFEDARYQNAIAGFENYLAQTPDNPQVLIYLGIAHMELDNYNDALSVFQKLKDGNSLDSSKANWYKALVYLKGDDAKSASEILKEITLNEANFKYKEAKRLLSMLD